MQLAARLGESAGRNGDALPESFRAHFLDGFQRAARAKGLEVGTGRAGAHLPPDITESIRPAIEQIGLTTFHEAYVPALSVTLMLPLAVLVLPPPARWSCDAKPARSQTSRAEDRSR